MGGVVHIRTRRSIETAADLLHESAREVGGDVSQWLLAADQFRSLGVNARDAHNLAAQFFGPKHLATAREGETDR